MEMDVKTEEKSALANIAICYLCLSTHRRVSSVDSVSYAYGLMTDWASQEGARVCWECRALLVRVLRFKVQALRAKEFLDTAVLCVSGEPIFFGKCMSQLSMRLFTSFSAEFSHSSDTANLTDFPNTSTVKEEVTLSDLETWAEAVPDDDFPNEFEVPLEVKTEEPLRKKRKRVKSEVKLKREVKSEAKVKRKKVKTEAAPEENERRQINDEVVQSFIATEAELTAYRLDVLNVMSKNSKFMCDTCLAPFKDQMKLQRHNDQCHAEVRMEEAQIASAAADDAEAAAAAVAAVAAMAAVAVVAVVAAVSAVTVVVAVVAVAIWSIAQLGCGISARLMRSHDDGCLCNAETAHPRARTRGKRMSFLSPRIHPA